MISGKIKAHFGVEVLVQEPSGAISRAKIARKSGHVVGDRVEIVESRLKRLERRNVLFRKTNFGDQTLAANLDCVGIVVSVTPKTPAFFIDQAIISCRSAHIDPFILVTKLDLPESAEFLQTLRETYANSVPVLAGMSELKDFLQKPVRLILVGVSGAGKSSLINQLVPDAGQKIGELSPHKSQGRHTTSGSMMFDLPSGSELIDSPGVRDFVPPDLTREEIARHFPGFEAFANTPCKFRDCLHQTEPGCVIREHASPERYQQYLALIA